MKSDLPSWLCKEQEISKKYQNSSYISKNIISLLSVLRKFKNQSENFGSSWLKLIILITQIVFVSLSKNMITIYVFAGILMCFCAFLKGEQLKRIFSVSLGAVVMSAIILLPSLFISGTKSLLLITTKVFVSVTAVELFANTTSHSSLVSALKAFHLSDLIIYVFDTTFKYIYILGNICYEMLCALKTRVTHSSRQTKKAVSAIPATAFIKSKEMANEVAYAMECRGFNGVYIKSTKSLKLTLYDIILIIYFALCTTAFAVWR